MKELMVEHMCNMLESIGFGTDNEINGAECVDVVNEFVYPVLRAVQGYQKEG